MTYRREDRISFNPSINTPEQREIHELLDRLQTLFPSAPDVLNIEFSETSFGDPLQLGHTEAKICETGLNEKPRARVRLLDRSQYKNEKSTYQDTIGHELGHLLVGEYLDPQCEKITPEKSRAANKLYETFRKTFEDEIPELTHSDQGLNGWRRKGFVSYVGFFDFQNQINKFKEKYEAGSTEFGTLLRAEIIFDIAHRQQLAQGEPADVFPSGHIKDPVLEDLVDTVRYYLLGQTYANDDPVVSRKVAAIQEYATAVFSNPNSSSPATPAKNIPPTKETSPPKSVWDDL